MRKITAGLFMSLDGVVESPEKWTFPYFNDETAQAIGASFAASDTLLLGRRTYEEFASVWPGRGTDDPMGYAMNNMPKLVVSKTLKKVEWNNSSLIEGDVVEELTKLKAEPGKNLSISGSPTLVRSLLRDKVLDELQLFVYPIVLGAGKRLFDGELPEIPLELVDAQTFSNGVLRLNYQPAPA